MAKVGQGPRKQMHTWLENIDMNEKNYIGVTSDVCSICYILSVFKDKDIVATLRPRIGGWGSWRPDSLVMREPDEAWGSGSDFDPQCLLSGYGCLIFI